MIPDEAVNAAAQVVKRLTMLLEPNTETAIARSILEAAAPHMQPAARDDVAEGNRQHLAAFREWKPGDPVE